MSGGDWVWITLSAPWLCWAVTHVMSMCVWQSTARVYRLRLPRGATVEQVGSWVAQLAAVLRAPRWWDVFPRWPVGVELVATAGGIERLIVMPARLRKAVVASLTAALPGARLDTPPDPPPRRSFPRVKAGEIRLRGAGQLLAIDRGEDTSRHLLAAVQPLHRGEVVRVQWLLVAARAPRPPRGDQTVSTDSARVVTRDRQQQLLGVRWQQRDPVLSAVCRIGATTRDRPQARAVLRCVRAALRGQDVPGARITRRWLPSVVVVARLSYRTIPLARWPLTLTSREIAGLLGLATGPLPLPGVSTGVAPALPPSPITPQTGLVIAKANYPGINQLLCLNREDRLRHLWIAGPTGVGKSTLLANLIGYDIHRGDPVIVIDAGGDLVTDVLAHIPESRHDDVLVLDPTNPDTDHVIGLNPLHSRGPEDHELAAGLVFHALASIYASSWGPRTADIVRAGLLTLTQTHAPNGQRFTLGELIELLTNTGFRRFVTTQPLTPTLGAFWSWYEQLSDTQRFNIINPALNKLRAFSLYTPPDD